MKLMKIIQSVLSSFIGIQKKSKLINDDKFIEDHGIMPYFIVGLILAVVFIFSIISVVSFILG